MSGNMKILSSWRLLLWRSRERRSREGEGVESRRSSSRSRSSRSRRSEGCEECLGLGYPGGRSERSEGEGNKGEGCVRNGSRGIRERESR